MKTVRWLVLLSAFAVGSAARGQAPISWADTNPNWTNASSWREGVVPGATNVAQFLAQPAIANQPTIGASNVTARGILFVNNGTNWNLSGTGTASIGADGLTYLRTTGTGTSTLQPNLTLTASQVWRFAAGQTVNQTGTVTSAAAALRVIGPGTVNSSGNNTGFAGALNVVGGNLRISGAAGQFNGASAYTLGGGGSITLDNAAAVLDTRLSGDALFTSLGGTLALVAGAAGGVFQNVGDVATNGGNTRFVITPATGGLITQLTLNNLSRAAGATQSFTSTAGTLGTSFNGPVIIINTPPALNDGIIGGHATSGDTFASYDPSFGVSRLTTFSTAFGGTASGPNNVSFTAANVPSLNGTNAVNSFRLSGATAATATATTADSVLRIDTGGLISTGGTHTIGGGDNLNIIRSNPNGTTTGGEVFFHVPDNSLTLNAGLRNPAVGTTTVVKSGAGTLFLGDGATTVTNSYTGPTFVNEGTLAVRTGAVPTATNYTVAGGVLESQVATPLPGNITLNYGSLRAGGGASRSFAGTVTVGNVAGNVAVLDTGGTANTLSFTNATSRIAGGGADVTLAVRGGGTALFDANITYGGQVAIESGRLRVTAASTIAAVSGFTVGPEAANNAQLFFDNVYGTAGLATSQIRLLTNGGTFTGTGEAGAIRLAGAGGTLVLANPVFASAISGQATGPSIAVAANNTLQLSGAVTGNGLVNKVEGGNLVLTGSSPNFAGGLQASAGTLRLGAAGILSPRANVVLSGGTFTSANDSGVGQTQTLGTLSMTASSTLALGTGDHTLRFAAADAANFTGTLTITGFTGTGGLNGTSGEIVFTANPGFSAAQLNSINFTGFDPGAALITFNGTGGGFELVPVPEPATVLGLGAAAAGLVRLVRRRRQSATA